MRAKIRADDSHQNNQENDHQRHDRYLAANETPPYILAVGDGFRLELNIRNLLFPFYQLQLFRGHTQQILAQRISIFQTDGTIISHSFYQRYPEEFYRFYKDKMLYPDAKPGITHLALAKLEKEGKLPDAVLACVGGGSNAMGMFYEFIKDENVRLIGCEAAGRGVNTGETAATIAVGTEGIFHGMKSYFCQNEYGQIAPVYSISAGLDYPGIGPEHAYLHDIGRAEYVPVTDEEAVCAFEYIAKTEGIIAAIESSHAIAQVMKLAPTMRKDQIIICCVSGRGDKDVAAIARYRGIDLYD